MVKKLDAQAKQSDTNLVESTKKLDSFFQIELKKLNETLAHERDGFRRELESKDEKLAETTRELESKDEKLAETTKETLLFLKELESTDLKLTGVTKERDFIRCELEESSKQRDRFRCDLEILELESRKKIDSLRWELEDAVTRLETMKKEVDRFRCEPSYLRNRDLRQLHKIEVEFKTALERVSKERTRRDEAEQGLVLFARKINRLLFSCHANIFVCAGNAQKAPKVNKCPICRKPIENRLEIYSS